MAEKTQYTFAIGSIFAPAEFDETITHVATSWQISDQPEFGDDGRSGDRSFIIYESLLDTTALKTLRFNVEDVLLPFRDYFLRAKYHSDYSAGIKLDPLVLKCTEGSNVVEIRGRQNALTKQVEADSSAIIEILYGMRVDYVTNLLGIVGGNMFSSPAVVTDINYTNQTLTLSQNCLFNGAYIFELDQTFESEWSPALRFDSADGFWATIEFITQPVDIDVPLTQSAVLTVLAQMSDSTAIAYQWQIRNAQGQFQDVSGETSTTLNISNVSLTQDGSVYRVKATSNYGQLIISNEVTLTVIPITITVLRDPRDAAFVQGGTAVFDVVASIVGNANITYQWQKQEAVDDQWVDISGATSSLYSLTSLDSTNDLGDKYRVKVSNDLAPTIFEFSEQAELIAQPYDLTLVYPDNTSQNWTFELDGPVICDSSVGNIWNVIPQSPQSVDIKMWGKSTTINYSGYSEGRVSLAQNNDYRIHTNVGGGQPGDSSGWVDGYPGGGYSGIFNGLTASQSSAIMIAGGAGGPGSGHGMMIGGDGGGTRGIDGADSNDSEINSTGGGGASQTSGGSAGNADGNPGGALQGGQGGDASTSGYPNAGGGGGGGGGYYGGGGGGGGNDNGNSTRNASGGGGGSGYFDSSIVTSGLTANVDDDNLLSEGGTWDDEDPNRNGAGYNDDGSARLILTTVLGQYYTDPLGRYLIFSNCTYMTPPSAMQRTFGTVYLGDTKCIDNARWQSIRNSAGNTSATNYRIQFTIGGSKKPWATGNPTDYNLYKMRTANVLPLVTDLTDWGSFADVATADYYRNLVYFAWHEDALDSYAGELWGYGLDYTGLSYGDYNSSPQYYTSPGTSAFAQSVNSSIPTFSGSYDSNPTLSMWIIPPGVAPITGSTRTATAQVYEAPTCNPALYQSGWYTRTGGNESTPDPGARQIVVLFDGVVILDSKTETVTVNPFDGTITKDGWTYEPSTHRGSVYGWASDGVTCGQQSSPSGDVCNSFDVIRY
jgi:hypothetical protein